MVDEPAPLRAWYTNFDVLLEFSEVAVERQTNAGNSPAAFELEK
jgi:hypothetical protein